MKLILLDKVILRINDPGNEFFKGYSANHTSAPRNAFVDIKGKVVATFDQIAVGDEEFLVAMEPVARENMEEHFAKYMPILKVKIVPTDMHAYFDLTGDYVLQEGEYAIPQRAGQMILTGGRLEATVREEEFLAFRLEHLIPIQGVDYTDQMLLNISPDEYAAFNKGCYLGQEVLSRVHFKSRPPKRLAVRLQSQCSEKEIEDMTSAIQDPETGEVRGFLFVSNKDS